VPVIWSPQERQRLVLSCPHPEILYGGAAGGGKTDALIGDWLSHQERYGANARGVLFRNSYPELQEVLGRMHMVYGAIGAKWKEKDAVWTFPNGSQLRLSYLDSFEDALKHRGSAWTWRGHDELTMRPTDEEYLFLASRMRSAYGIPTRTVSTTNPGGPGHSWVMKRWKIDRSPFGMKPIHSYLDIEKNIILDEGSQYDALPDAELPVHIRRNTRIFIPGRLSDNKFLDSDGHYRAHLLALPEAQRRMLLDGRWDIVEGAFFDEWDPHYHVVKAFAPPEGWKRWMSGDWGTSAPYAFVWFCQSPNGEIFIYRELYGTQADPNLDKGVKEAPSTVAERILAIEQESDEYISERWLDASCFDNHEMGLSVSEQFRNKGIHFQPSQKKFKSGSIAMFRDYLKVTNGMCRFHVMNNCVHLIRTLPALMVDKNNVEQYDTNGPDHILDALIYGIRRNIKTKEELQKARGIYDRNLRMVKRFGAFGAH
jgi:hypothetical protein